MTSTARRIPVVPIALAATLLTAFLLVFVPQSASAHDALLGSSPAPDSTVDTLPGEIALTFSEKLITGDGATEVVVTDAAGVSVTDGVATVDGAIVTQPLVAEAAAGAYHVVWKIVSSDGHPTSGEFSFTVMTSTLGAVTAEPTAAPTPSQTPDAIVTSAPTTTAPDASGAPADSAGIWVILAVGVLAVAAVVLVLLSRRGRRSPAESDDVPGR